MTDPDRVSISRRYALVLFVVAIVAGATGPTVLPQGLIWITVAVLFWAAGTIWYRTVDRPKQPDPEEVSDTGTLSDTP